jgi:hypothetical protein
MSEYRKVVLWGVRFYVIRETELEMHVSARLSLIPIGVPVPAGASSGWSCRPGSTGR